MNHGGHQLIDRLLLDRGDNPITNPFATIATTQKFTSVILNNAVEDVTNTHLDGHCPRQFRSLSNLRRPSNPPGTGIVPKRKTKGGEHHELQSFLVDVLAPDPRLFPWCSQR